MCVVKYENISIWAYRVTSQCHRLKALHTAALYSAMPAHFICDLLGALTQTTLLAYATVYFRVVFLSPFCRQSLYSQIGRTLVLLYFDSVFVFSAHLSHMCKYYLQAIHCNWLASPEFRTHRNHRTCSDDTTFRLPKKCDTFWCLDAGDVRWLISHGCNTVQHSAIWLQHSATQCNTVPRSAVFIIYPRTSQQ